MKSLVFLGRICAGTKSYKPQPADKKNVIRRVVRITQDINRHGDLATVTYCVTTVVNIY